MRSISSTKKAVKKNSTTRTAAHEFVTVVMAYAAAHGRHTLPWRATHDPYHILVSECMLQQTQVPRVIPKYRAFLTAFPTLTSLAHASLLDVYRLWQGLGYNRRARFLYEAACACVRTHGGVLPDTVQELERLAGIGPYTARAVAVFAYARPEIVIETNVRAAVIHHFFPRARTKIPDARIVPILEEVLCVVRERALSPREWYGALMDYGTHIKAAHGNPARKSSVHKKQPAFKGSVREVRGALFRVLAAHPQGLSVQELRAALASFDAARMGQALAGMEKDGMIERVTKHGRVRVRVP